MEKNSRLEIKKEKRNARCTIMKWNMYLNPATIQIQISCVNYIVNTLENIKRQKISSLTFPFRLASPGVPLRDRAAPRPWLYPRLLRGPPSLSPSPPAAPRTSSPILLFARTLAVPGTRQTRCVYPTHLLFHFPITYIAYRALPITLPVLFIIPHIYVRISPYTYRTTFADAAPQRRTRDTALERVLPVLS